jgi:hypothetical protein
LFNHKSLRKYFKELEKIMGIRQLLIALVAICFASSVYAATSKHISHRIDASTLESVEILIPVVQMEIEVYDGDDVELEIDIHSQRRMWVFGRRNVDDIELEIDRDGNDLTLGINEKNLEQTWRVKIPRNLALNMNIGVGEVKLYKFANDLDVDLGVGEVSVLVDDLEYRSINLSVGVGETTIRGFEHSARSNRDLVSDSTHYNGSGEHRMDIEVGVGEARVVNR